MLIVFEGIDRSGKSTQCLRLYEYYLAQGNQVTLLRYPDRKSECTGALINDYLSKKIDLPLSAASLLLASNLWEMSKALTEALQNGKIIIMDRYTWSNVAYSTARGMSRQSYERIILGLPKPDYIIFMDAEVETVTKRGDFGKEKFDDVDFQRKVSSIMRSLSTTEKEEEDYNKTVVIRIDANQNPDQIFAQIIQSIRKP